ncbi:MAG: O-succinylbenzoic acid--CoA ligase [Marivirga sp.]|jgi:O-succinylbenzoic acid--CoA ligase
MSSTTSSTFQLTIGTLNFDIKEILTLQDLSKFNTLERQVVRFIQVWKNPELSVTQQTSGSTGVPKEIKLLKSQMMASARSTVKALKLIAGDKAYLSVHPDYIGGKMMIVRAIEHHLTLIIGPIIANPLKDLQDNVLVDFFSFVPYQLQTILEESAAKIKMLNKAKAIILGGAAVSNTLEQLIKEKLTAPCYSTYGMTETVSHVALKRLNGNLVGGVFHAIAGVQFAINAHGCLIIYAPHITNVAALLTNDVVRLISPTQFEWLGRHDFIINSGGIKIQAEELEQRIGQLLNEQGIHNNFFVFGKAHEKWGEQLTLLIEASEPIMAIESYLKDLPKTKRPKQIYYLDRFLYTGNDKLNRADSIRAALSAH